MKKLLCLSLIIFSFSFAYGQQWLWAKADVDSANSDLDPIDLTTDNAGNIFETGVLIGSVNFGTLKLAAPPSTADAFLIKYDNNGNAIWGVAPYTYQVAKSIAVATGKTGNVCMVGGYEDSMTIGTYRFPNTYNTDKLFVAMFTSTGILKWGAYSNKGAIAPIATTIDKWGNTYITGFFSDSVYLGSFGMYSGRDCFYIAKYDTNGKVIWAKTAKPNTWLSTYTTGTSMVTDTIGNIYVAGEFTDDSITIGSVTIITAAPRSVFIAKFDSAGNLTWLKSPLITSSSAESYLLGLQPGRFLSIDNAENLYLSGMFHDTVQFGATILATNYLDIFLVKYSPIGNVLWAKESSPTNINSNTYQVYSSSCNKAGSIYICGTFKDSIGFNSVELKSDSTWPSFLFSFDSSGNAVCGSEVNNSNDDNNSVAADPLSNGVFFSGDIENEYGCYFGSYFLTGTGGEYGFLAKWTCSTTEGVNEIGNKNEGMSVYPNPNNGVFTITLSHPELVSGSQTIEVYNVMGERVKSEELRAKSEEVDMGAQPNGIYFYRVIEENGELVGAGKLIIQK